MSFDPYTASAIPPRLPVWKIWLFRALAALLLPAALLLGLELSLRIAGFGYPTQFLLAFQKDGRDSFVQNNQFGWRFFGRRMARAPHPFCIPLRKAGDTVRVFVFGESAAFGDPQPAFGLPRMLQALLELRHPGTKFEVINAAMTGINSHGIRTIARDCTKAQGDVWVIYMGNNEVVGPYGAGTVFTRQSLPLPLIRASIALKGSRIGQLLESLLERKRPSQEWGGLSMFMKQQMTFQDPRLAGVYTNFQKNLNDIIGFGRQSGAGVVVSTIGVNVKDCPPFGATHCGGLSPEALGQWSDLWQKGLNARAAKSHEAARQLFHAAEAIDDQHAELKYALGESSSVLGDLAEAKMDYAAARELDTLRFRCDRRLNELIRQDAGHDGEHVLLVDAETRLSEACADHLPGNDLFYDHVHLTFEGNYVLARGVAEQVETLLAKRLGGEKMTGQSWASQLDCAQRLGWSEFARRNAWLEMLPRLSDQPFTTQFEHLQRLERVRDRIGELTPAALPAAIGAALARNEAVMARWPGDADLCVQTAVLAEAAGQTNQAAGPARQAVELVPTSVEAWSRLGAALEKQGELEAAAEAYRRVITLGSEAFYGWNNLGRVLGKLGRTTEAMNAYRKVVAMKPRFGPAWLSLGELLEGLGRKPEAEECYQRALLNPIRSAVELNRLAGFCHDRGWFQAAATNLAEAISLNPSDLAMYLHAGQNFSAAGSHREAENYFSQAIHLAPESGPARFLYGQELGSQGKPVEAEKQFRRAVELMPNVPEAQLNLAVTLASQGRTGDAITEYETVLARWPTNQMARRNLEHLRSATSSAPGL